MSTRFSSVRSDHVEYSGWLVVDEAGGMKLGRARPSLSTKERAVAISLTVPRSVFKTPELKVSIEVSEGRPPDMSAVAQTVADALAAGTDLKVEVVVP